MAITSFKINDNVFFVCRRSVNEELDLFQAKQYLLEHAKTKAVSSHPAEFDYINVFINEQLRRAIPDNKIIVFGLAAVHDDRYFDRAFMTFPDTAAHTVGQWVYVESSDMMAFVRGDNQYEKIEESIPDVVLASIRSDKPRVTPALMAYLIDGIYYSAPFNGIASSTHLNSEKVINSLMGPDAQIPPSLELTTFCHIVLKNKRVFTGVSACISPENYRVDFGKKYAFEDAFVKLWEPVGNLLAFSLNAADVLNEFFKPLKKEVGHEAGSGVNLDTNFAIVPETKKDERVSTGSTAFFNDFRLERETPEGEA